MDQMAQKKWDLGMGLNLNLRTLKKVRSIFRLRTERWGHWGYISAPWKTYINSTGLRTQKENMFNIPSDPQDDSQRNLHGHYDIADLAASTTGAHNWQRRSMTLLSCQVPQNGRNYPNCFVPHIYLVLSDVNCACEHPSITDVLLYLCAYVGRNRYRITYVQND
jgi:hypothetical protein